MLELLEMLETLGFAAATAVGAVAVAEAAAGAGLLDSVASVQAEAEIEADSAGAGGAVVAPEPGGTVLAMAKSSGLIKIESRLRSGAAATLAMSEARISRWRWTAHE